MRLVSYNIQYSLGADGEYDLARSLATVHRADIICLQEVERNWRRSGMTDQPDLIEKTLAERYCVYGAQFDADASYRYAASGRVVNRRRQIGQMTISRWPIVAARCHTFPKIDTGARFNLVTGALETVIATPDGPLRLFNIHLSDAACSERLAQIRHLMNLLHNTATEGSIWNGSEANARHWQTDVPPPPMPTEAILLGDFNAEPRSMEYATLLLGTLLSEAGAAEPGSERLRFIDSWVAAGHDLEDGVTYRANAAQGADWDQRLDYCFLPETMARRLKNAWIDDAAIASDHQPIWVELD
ncbi:MAG TPA: endonuclease/exonuclease/phosphatase family protein [Dongiaceae bacterium]|nr:endonuclease/exonuclease/phosphatase family protein [Dongiaceae bacterium]